jgi:hypothetical protein
MRCRGEEIEEAVCILLCAGLVIAGHGEGLSVWVAMMAFSAWAHALATTQFASVRSINYSVSPPAGRYPKSVAQ